MTTIIVDGYNFIGRSKKLRINDSSCREKLIRSLTEYCRLRKREITIVFDGAYLGCLVNKKQTYGRVTVIYSSGGSNADEEIKKLIRGNRQKRQLLIVTSDNEIRDCARSMGARVTRSEEFEREMEKVFAQNHVQEKANRRLSRKEIEEWIKIFSQPFSEEEELNTSMSCHIKTGFILDQPDVPAKEKLSESPQEVSQEDPVERRGKIKRFLHNSSRKRELDRVHIHLSEKEIQEWLRIFGNNEDMVG